MMGIRWWVPVILGLGGFVPQPLSCSSPSCHQNPISVPRVSILAQRAGGAEQLRSTATDVGWMMGKLQRIGVQHQNWRIETGVCLRLRGGKIKFKDTREAKERSGQYKRRQRKGRRRQTNLKDAATGDVGRDEDLSDLSSSVDSEEVEQLAGRLERQGIELTEEQLAELKGSVATKGPESQRVLQPELLSVQPDDANEFPEDSSAEDLNSKPQDALLEFQRKYVPVDFFQAVFHTNSSVLGKEAG